MIARRLLPAFLFLVASVAVGQTAGDESATLQTGPVVFVCEHGSAKSLLGASLFNREAAKRGLPYRAVARGVTPDAFVPTKLSAILTAEGFDVAGYKPTRVTSTDMAAATRVVAIGVDLSSFMPRPPVRVDQWNDVPSANADYVASHDTLKRHIDALLSELQSKAP